MSIPSMLLGSQAPSNISNSLIESLGKLRYPTAKAVKLPFEEGRFDTYDEFRLKYGIDFNPSPDFQFRSDQARVADIFLSESVDVLCLGPTSSGKTLVAWLAALASITQGKRVVFTTPTHDLNRQPFEKLPQRLGVPSHIFKVIEQGCSEKVANQIISDPKIRILSMTPQSARKYMDGLFPDGEGILIADEMQRFVGDSAGAKLISELPQSVRVLFLTAETTKSIEEMKTSTKRLRDMREESLTANERLKLYTAIQLQLDEELQHIADHIGSLINEHSHRLCRLLVNHPELIEEVSEVFRGTKDIHAPFIKPGAIGAVLALGNKLNKKKNSVKNEDFFEVSMGFHTCNHLYQCYISLTVFGKGELLAGLIRSHRKGLNKIDKSSKLRECSPGQIRNVAVELSKQSSFRTLCDMASEGTELVGFLDCSFEKLPNDKQVREALVAYPRFLHPKEQFILQELARRPDSVIEKGVLSFCSRTCTSMILPERINRFMTQKDMFPDYLVGKGQTIAEREQRANALAQFKARNGHFLIGTDTIIYGVDTESDLLIAYDVARSGSDYEQLAGRAGRRLNIGEIVLLITVGSIDEIRFHAANRSQAAKRKKREK